MALANRSNIDDDPHVNAIRSCEDTVTVNRLALVRLLMMSERVNRVNGSDRVAKSLAFDALGVDGVCRTTDDIEIQQPTNTHDLEVGNCVLDKSEPTPSPEANTVRVTELTGERADKFVVGETGKTVAEHNPGYPNDDLVVAGTYPNMGGSDKTWHFPESRLQ